MATPVQFDEADAVEDYPEGQTSAPLPVKRFPRSTTSCWKLTPEEIRHVAETGLIWLTTATYKKLDEAPEGARWQPPVRIAVSKEEALRGW